MTQLTYEEAVERYYEHQRAAGHTDEQIACPCSVRSKLVENSLGGHMWLLENVNGSLATVDPENGSVDVALDRPVKAGNERFAEEYRNWCCANNRVHFLGKYGPERRLPIDAPLEDIVEMMREAGVEPTFGRVEGLLSALQINHFDDPHGGCTADGGVVEHILGTASMVIEEWVEQGTFNERYPTVGEAMQVEGTIGWIGERFPVRGQRNHQGDVTAK